MWRYDFKGEEIFNRSKHIWDKFLNRTSSYKYDGLIYTPCDLAVGYDDTLDFDLKTNITWFMNFKWKPPYENTIDFVVKEEKELISEFNTNKIEKSKVRVKSSVDKSDTRVYTKYKTYTLLVAGHEDKVLNPCKNKKALSKGRYLLKDFAPNYPYQKNAHTAKIELDSFKNEVLGNHWTHTHAQHNCH